MAKVYRTGIKPKLYELHEALNIHIPILTEDKGGFHKCSCGTYLLGSWKTHKVGEPWLEYLFVKGQRWSKKPGWI